MDGWIILIFIAFAAAALVGMYFAHQAQQRRLIELSRFAAERGWRFDAAKDHSHDGRYSHFPLFTQGSSRYAYNTIRGGFPVANQVWPVQLGDYHYTTQQSNGKTTQTVSHHLSYVIVETPYLGLPALYIRGEGLFDKLASLLGFDDIDFESAEFSRRFVVKSRDKRFAYDVLHPRMMQFMLDETPPTIDFRQGQCCLSLGERCWTPQQFADVLRWLGDFYGHWPRHVTASVSDRVAADALRQTEGTA